MSAEALGSLQAEGFNIQPGQMGEQIIIEGIDLGSVGAGDQIQLGDAVIEVVNQRTGCDRFQHIQGKSPALAQGRMGVMARVVADGTIHVGAPVRLLQAEERAV